MKTSTKKLLQIIISAILSVIIVLLEHFLKLNDIIVLILYLIVYIFLSYKIIFKAFRNLFHGEFLDENFLMTIASIGAFVIGEHIEGIVVMLFYQIGELFEAYAVKKSRRDITNLMDIKPQTATKIIDGKEIVTDPMMIAIGDTLVVKVGEKIPLDGKIIKGNTELDTSSLTGEAVPIFVEEGNDVLAGTINIGKVIYLKVTKEYNDSTVAKILDLVENASNRKTKTENFISRFAKYYTPIVVGLAVLLAIVPSIITKDYQTWIYRALSFLVVSCPCALVISVPLSFFSGVGAASKCGILIKGTNYLELLAKANIFVFDKTGTLTKGNFEVEDVYSRENTEEMLKLGWIAEAKSNHPIAKSIVKYVESHLDLDLKDEFAIEEIPGKGIIAKKDNDLILAGNDKLLDMYHIAYQKCSFAGTIIYIVKNKQYYGYFLIKDQLKEDSKEVIDQLNKKNYQTIMLTGDKKEVAEDVSKRLNLSSYQAELLPDGKAKALEALLANKSKKDIVAYFGDGINDAPVLMLADIGISMGNIGSDSAIEASDVVFMYDKLTSIIEAKKIAKKTMRIVYENIIMSLGIKVIVLLLSAFGITNIWLAIFADVGVCILAILNAMRAMKIKK